MPNIGQFGTGPYGLGSYGGLFAESFRLLSAESLNSYTVVLQFNAPLNLSYAPNYLPVNYVIPGLTVSRVTQNPSNPTSVILRTSKQQYILYTVTVLDVQNIQADTPDPQHRFAEFTGYSLTARFNARALAANRIRLFFYQPMLADNVLRHHNSYAVQNENGVYNPVLSATLEQPSNVTSVVLTLQNNLVSTEWYRVDVSGLIKTVGGLSVIPRSATFQWVSRPPSVQVGIDKFTGEARGGLFGNPMGQVFFSPALEEPLANSAIEVEEVAVCTTAYDSYTVPQPIDPFPLYTWKKHQPLRGLGAGVVLWGAFPRLMDAKFDLVSRYEDEAEPPSDGAVSLSFSYSSYTTLNSNRWTLHAPYNENPFQTASNLSPMGPDMLVSMVLGVSTSVTAFEKPAPRPVDGPAVAILETPSLPLALLNNDHWTMFPEPDSSHEVFTTASNLAPIGSPYVVTIPLSS